jgi:hypothetical protein
VTLYQVEVHTLGDALRKAAALLAEAYAERIEAWQVAGGEPPFPDGRQGVLVSIVRDGELCAAGLRVTLSVRLRWIDASEKRHVPWIEVSEKHHVPSTSEGNCQ